MADDFGLLVDEIRRVLPESRLDPVDEHQLAAIKEQYPDVPEHYLAFLRQVGWGALGDSCFALYRGPRKPDAIFEKETAKRLAGILFFGDNFAGWMVGFDTRNDWQIVGVDCGRLKPHPQKARTVAEFVAQEVARG